MRVASLSEVKNDLSRMVDRVRRGERIRILVRGRAAADLVPVQAADAGWDADLAALEREGIVRRGKPASAAVLAEIDRPGPRVKGASVVDALLAERRGSR